MAHYHVLEATSEQIRIAAHVAIPAGANQFGKQWSECVLERYGAVTSIVPAGSLGVGEAAALSTGGLVEFDFWFHYHPDANGPATLARLEAEVATRRAARLAQLQIELRHWGRSGNV